MKKRECKKVLTLMEDFCLGALAPPEAERVEGHLSRCPSCAKVGKETERLLALLKKDALSDPGEIFWVGLKGRIMEEVRQQARTGSTARWTFPGFGALFGRPTYAWATAVILLIFLPLVLVRFFDFSAERPSWTVTALPRAGEVEEISLAPRPEPLAKLMASLTEKESLRLAEKVTHRLGHPLFGEIASPSLEEKVHWNLQHSLEGLKEEELEALVKKLDPGKSARWQEEERFYVG